MRPPPCSTSSRRISVSAATGHVTLTVIIRAAWAAFSLVVALIPEETDGNDDQIDRSLNAGEGALHGFGSVGWFLSVKEDGVGARRPILLRFACGLIEQLLITAGQNHRVGTNVRELLRYGAGDIRTTTEDDGVAGVTFHTDFLTRK